MTWSWIDCVETQTVFSNVKFGFRNFSIPIWLFRCSAIVQPPVVERNRPPSVNVQSPADPPAPQHEAAPPCPEAQLPTLVHITPAGGRPVLGVAAAGDEVYVVRHATPEVEVYEAAGLTLRRRIQMPGLGSWPFGLAVGTGCLYVSDFVNNAIHRVETVGMSTVTAR